MLTIVYQGIPSFLDTQFNESRTLRLKLASPRSHLTHSLEMGISTVFDSESKILLGENGDSIMHKISAPSTEPSKTKLGGLSFLETLPSIAQTPNERPSEYVHPLVKRASSVLSDKSLELCTENLGSETGTDIIEDENNIFSRDSSRKVLARKSHVASSKRMSTKKTFPPPLSTMMGSDAVQVRPVRENGRLILQAVKIQPKVTCFQADRSNGRLRLRLMDAKNSTSPDLSTSDQDGSNSSSFEDEVENSLVTKEGYLVGKLQGKCKEDSGNAVGMLLDDSESLWVAS